MTESTTPRLETAIRLAFAPELRADGFSGSGRTFRRTHGVWIQVVNLQGSRYGGSFAINIAIHPHAVPDVLGKQPDPKRITQELCEFRRRLSEADRDQWWEHGPSDESMRSAVEKAAKVYGRVGRPLFTRMCGTDSPLNTITASDFAAGRFDFGGFDSTEVRTALVLARLRKSDNRISESAAFASFALAHLGNATLLRHELETLAAQQ